MSNRDIIHTSTSNPSKSNIPPPHRHTMSHEVYKEDEASHFCTGLCGIRRMADSPIRGGQPVPDGGVMNGFGQYGREDVYFHTRILPRTSCRHWLLCLHLLLPRLPLAHRYEPWPDIWDHADDANAGNLQKLAQTVAQKVVAYLNVSRTHNHQRITETSG
ncbi:hypothetical protein BC835DRAFT_1343476 [Cytidiella melzeri]|nr:hypothetical protein BC835DRAFT_1343476 [Cytidiella melzeri]